MTGFLLFLGSVVLISLSGVLMPGPITAITVVKGSRHWRAGSLVALGHGVVEFPLIGLIYLGVGILFQKQIVRTGIGILGGAVLIWMGIEMLINSRRARITSEEREINPFLGGILLSIGNPYFLLWWATIGASLTVQAMNFGAIGVVSFALVHWFCDLAWLQFLSWLSFQGGRFFGRKLQITLFIICGLAMLYFGMFFLTDAVLGRMFS